MSLTCRLPILILTCTLLAGLSACVTTSKRQTSVPCLPCVAPQASAPAPSKQESLLDFVPDNAIAAFIVRHDALAFPHKYLGEQPTLHSELRLFLVDKLGVDLTAVDGVVVWMTAFEESSVALFVRVRQEGAINLKGRVTEQFQGVPIIHVGKDLFAVTTTGGFLLGGLKGLKEAMDAIVRPHAPSATGVRATLLKLDPSLQVVLALDAVKTGEKDFDDLIEQYGITAGHATFGPDRVLTVKLEGDRQRLQGLLDMSKAAQAMALLETDRQKATALAGASVPEALGGIWASYEIRRLLSEIFPRFEGETLVSRYKVEEWGTVSLAVGIATALAIPAYNRYLKQSKSVSVNYHLESIARAAVTLHEAAKGGARFTFPANTPWTPGADCCGQKRNQCAIDPPTWNHPTWKALKFSPEGPTYYQYRFVSMGKGKKATFTVEARGDLDCNQTWSHYSITGHVNGQGVLEIGKIKSMERRE
jgi:hypothetical protein